MNGAGEGRRRGPPWRPDHRPVYTHEQLKRLIDPASVAIVGLSRNPQSFGARTRRNLAHWTAGRLYGVNPGADELHGVQCSATIAALPEVPDCAVIATPVETVEQLVEQCAAAGVGGCIIFASGFAETGREDRIALQARLGAIARGSSLRIVGPNCIGLINNLRQAGLLFVSTYGEMEWRAGPVGLVSQSGGLGQSMVQVVARGGSFSHFLAAGNSVDVDVCDYVSYLADDPGCTVIGCVAEGVSDGERLLEAGERALKADKPVVMYKIATGSAGAQAAMSHTGTLAGSGAAYDAAYRRAGFIKVDNIEDVYETAAFLAKAGKPKAGGVAAVAASGGACVITLDKAEAHGVPMPKPGPATQAVLEANVPEFGSPTNPCDITAQVATNPSSYAACASALLQDPAYAALVVMAPSINPKVTPSNVQMFAGLAEAAGKPVCMSWLSEWHQGPGAFECEASPRVALFQKTDDCFRTLSAWLAREGLADRPPLRPRVAAEGRAAALLREAGEGITEREAKAMLAAYGVPTAQDVVVAAADAAVQAAEAMGYPVVLKVESPDIAHKTEAGVVRLHLADAGQVRLAYHEVMAAAGRIWPPPQVRGVLVQPMIPAGIEVVVGAQLDPTFGPMVVVGLGGVLVEVLRDSTAELAPVSHGQALEMLGRLKGYRLLEGYRGQPGADLDKLAEIIVAVSDLATDHAGDIAEIDVNPIICSPGRCVAVDALIVRRPAKQFIEREKKDGQVDEFGEVHQV